MDNKYELHNNKEAKRYEFRIGDTLCMIEYIKTEKGDMYLTHTEVPEELEGKGIGTALVKQVLDDIKEQGGKVVPMCPFVAAYIKRHPEYKSLVLEGFNVG